jgi:hypothetical protein
MTFEQVWLFFLMVPPTLWMLLNFQRSSRRSFIINMFGALLLLAFSLSGFALRESSAAAEVLARALASLSEADLKRSSSG